MTKEEHIADQISSALKLDLYQNSRKLNLVDARALYCYILHKELNYTLYQVRDTFRQKGKSYHHCSVLHSVNIFDEVLSRREDIRELKDKILGRTSVKSLLLQKIKSIDNEEQLNQINNCINMTV